MALTCENLTAILTGCDNNPGGIDRKIYINDSSNVSGLTVTTSAHTITAINLASSTKFVAIEFRKNLASFTEEYTKNDDGAVVFMPKLSLPIHGRDAAKSRQISILAAGQRELDIIVPTNDGKYVYFRKMQLTAVADGSGANITDGSKYSLSFEGYSEELSLYTTLAAITPVLA